MGRQLYMHIGMPKSASSSIQGAFASLAPTLGRWGIHYPCSGRGSGTYHGGLVTRGRAWTDLAEEIRRVDATRFVLSVESFTGRARHQDWPRRVAALAAETNVTVRVVGYVRPQCQLVEALYSQWTVAGHNVKAFEDFAAEQMTSDLLDFNAVFEPWRRVFGTRAMVVRPLERSRLEGDVVTHFLSLLGVPASRWRTGLRANSRRPAKQLEVVRLAFPALGHLPRREALRLIDRVRAMLRPVFRNDLPVCPLTVEQACGVMARFDDANARFARDYRIDADGVLFREPVIDGRKRPHRASWQDFSGRERRLARRIVQHVAGVDIAPGSGADMRGTDWPALLYAAGYANVTRGVRGLGRNLRRSYRAVRTARTAVRMRAPD